MPNEQKTAVFSVAQINEYIKYLIEDSPVLDSVYVVGEISNLTAYHTSGHMYFSLKDETGVLRAVMFKSSAARLKFRPENGMRVIVHGRMTVYAPSGQYQISCDTMEPDGFGALAAAFEQLKAKLSEEGLFDESRKKPIPSFPHAVGVITSPTGAAVRDIINILTRRSPQTKMVLFPTLVQGDGAPKQLCSGIRYFNKYKSVDVIIIGRGGGSLEELWAFNNEELARTIAASEIPVISAVGHETDFTICDFVSDLRAPTPSAAAELAVPDREQLLATLALTRDALNSHIRSKLHGSRLALDALAKKRVLLSPDSFLQNRRMEIDAKTTRLALSVQQSIASAHSHLDPLTAALHNAVQKRTADEKARFFALTAKLDALNPLSVLTRGYSAVFNAQGAALRSVSDLHIGDTVHLRLSDGTADADIRQIHKDKEQTP